MLHVCAAVRPFLRQWGCLRDFAGLERCQCDQQGRECGAGTGHGFVAETAGDAVLIILVLSAWYGCKTASHGWQESRWEPHGGECLTLHSTSFLGSHLAHWRSVGSLSHTSEDSTNTAFGYIYDTHVLEGSLVEVQPVAQNLEISERRWRAQRMPSPAQSRGRMYPGL